MLIKVIPIDFFLGFFSSDPLRWVCWSDLKSIRLIYSRKRETESECHVRPAALNLLLVFVQCTEVSKHILNTNAAVSPGTYTNTLLFQSVSNERKWESFLQASLDMFDKINVILKNPLNFGDKNRNNNNSIDHDFRNVGD